MADLNQVAQAARLLGESYSVEASQDHPEITISYFHYGGNPDIDACSLLEVILDTDEMEYVAYAQPSCNEGFDAAFQQASTARFKAVILQVLAHLADQGYPFAHGNDTLSQPEWLI